jgi:Fungal Rad9-like Rad53-binding/BRCT domain, a BRCA1 C-terminus domain
MSKLDTVNAEPITCASDNQQQRLDHDNSRARAQSLQIPCSEVATEKALGTQSQPLPKKMSTQGSEEKTQEFGEEELTELVKKVQNDHVQRPGESDEDKPDNIDLLKSFEQSHVDRYDAEDDNDDDFGGELQVRAEIFPESKRFHHPTTPAMSGKKIHNADTVTPGLPANPFVNHEASSTEVVSMSQLFKYTQPSSPHRKAFRSDPASEFPSPADFKAFRSPDLPTSSSPMNITTKDQDPTELGSEGVAIKGLKNQKVRRARSSPANGRGDEDSSDDGFDSSAERLMIWRKREKQKIEEETRRQFEMVKAPSRQAANTKGKRRGKSKTQCSETKDRNHKFSLAPDSTAMAYAIVDDNTTEDEFDNAKTGQKSRNAAAVTLSAQAQAAKPHAVLDEQQVTISRATLPTYYQRNSSGVHLEGKVASASPPGQSAPVEDAPAVDQSQDTGLGVSRVVEVENSQPSLSQAKSGEAQHSSVSTLPSLPSSFRSGFLVSRSQDDNLLPSRDNPGFVDVFNEQSSYLPQPLGSSIIQGNLSRLQEPLPLQGNGKPCSQSQAGDGVPQDLVKRQAVIVGSSPRLPTALNPTEYGGSIMDTTVVENGESVEELASPQQLAHGSRPESSRVYGMRTPITTKPLFSANETTIPETSPAVGRASRPLLRKHLDQTPQPSPIPPKDDRKWSQGITVSRQHTVQSSDSNLFETARSQLSSPADPMVGINESNRQLNGDKGSEIESLKEFATDPIPLNEGVDVVMDNNQHKNEASNITPPAPAHKRRKGVRGRVIPEAGTKARLPNKAAKTSENKNEHTVIAQGQTVMPGGTSTAGKGEERLIDMAENVKASPKDAETPSDGGLTAGPKAGRASKKTHVPKTGVSGTKTSRTLRTDGDSIETASTTDPKQKGKLGTATAESDPEVIAPNRVLALFKNGNMSYYPATCRFVVGVDNPGYRVRFDDGTEDILESQNVRSFDLRVGDVVKVDLDNMRTRNYNVCGFRDRKDKNNESESPRRNRADMQDYPATDIHGYSTILLQQKQRDSLPNEGGSFSGEEIRVPISSVYILKSMWHKFDDRTYTHTLDFSRPSSRGQTSGELRSNPVTPTRARRMTPAALSHKGNSEPLGAISGLASGIFKGMVFAVTYLKQDGDKEQIIKQIVENGGKILEDGYEELFQPDWFVEASGDFRSFRLKREAERLGFACVIANVHSRKPKFLGALALGLPCLHGRWIKDCARKNEIVDWDPYLLPSGESSYLGGSTRSRILQPYPPLTAQLPNTIASRPKPLRGQSVIAVMGKGKAEDRRKAFLFLVFALGASRVHQVANIEAARRHLADSERGGESWDWVCINEKDSKKALSNGGAVSGRKRKRDSEDVESEIGISRVKIMSDDYVMQTVIMGRLMAEV